MFLELTLKKGHLWEGITVVGEELVIQRVGEQVVGGFPNELHAGILGFYLQDLLEEAKP
jgi:hypothetical protein